MSSVLDDALSDLLGTGPLQLLQVPGRQRRSQVGAVDVPASGDLPIVNIGRPRALPIEKPSLPPELKAAFETKAFFVLRLACSFRPVREEVTLAWAQLSVVLKADKRDGAVAFDLYPLSVEREEKAAKRLSLGAGLKFLDVGFGLADDFAYSVEYPAVEPLITAAGLHESAPSWNFTAVHGYPIRGEKLVLSVVAAPRTIQSLSVAVSLTADVDYRRRRFGVRLGRDQDTDVLEVPGSVLEVQVWP